MPTATPARRRFLQHCCRRAARVFLVTFFLCAWLGEASTLGALIWASTFTLFLGGGATYLSWEDGLTDTEVLRRLPAPADMTLNPQTL